MKNVFLSFLLIILALFFSTLLLISIPPNALFLWFTSATTSNAEHLIYFICGYTAILIAAPLFINGIISYLKKESRLRWGLIWLIFLILSLGSFKYCTRKLMDIIAPASEKQFSQECIAGLKKYGLDKNLLELSAKDPQSQMEKTCSKSSQVYFECLKNGGTKKNCLDASREPFKTLMPTAKKP